MAFEPMHLDHESASVRTSRVVTFTLAFVVFAGVLMAGLAVFYRSTVTRSSVVAHFQPFPGPRLQPNPTQDYANFRRAQLDELAGTRWVDRKANLIHVPIERAMAYVAAKGSAAYDPLEPASDQKLPPTPSDNAARADPQSSVAPYGQHP